MTTDALPTYRLVRSDDLPTSVEAARKAAKASPAAVRAVEAAMADGVARNDEEIWLACRAQGYLRSAATVRHGRLALSEAGALVDTGETRATSDGAASVVWKLYEMPAVTGPAYNPHLTDVAPPGTYGPGDYGPDSFGGSDYPSHLPAPMTQAEKAEALAPMPKATATERTLPLPGMQPPQGKPKRVKRVRLPLGDKCECGAPVARYGADQVRCSEAPDCSRTEARAATAEEMATLSAPAEAVKFEAEKTPIFAGQASLFDLMGEGK